MDAEAGIIVAISISLRRGVPKSNVEEAMLIADWGIEGDAHAGKWHRQVSLLAIEAIEQMIQMGADVSSGDFAENLTIRGLTRNLNIGDRICCGDAELEITQIGKECHRHCAIYEAVGDCVMPKEGVFARVITGGIIKKGMRVVRGVASPAESCPNIHASHAK